MRKTKEIIRTVISVLAAIIFFFLLYIVLAFAAIPAAALAIAMYFGMYFLLKPRTRIGNVEVDQMRGGEDSLRLMEEARADLASMEKNLPQIRSQTVAQSAAGLARTGSKILANLTEHPEKISGARRFADYYLDMAEKLESKYIDFQNNGITEGYPEDIMGQIGDALEVLNTAFEKQLTRLTEGELMEVAADIKVLRQTLKMEGDS